MTRSIVAYVHIYQGRDHQWYWRAKARNGRIVADGAEGYVTKSNAKRAAVGVFPGIVLR